MDKNRSENSRKTSLRAVTKLLGVSRSGYSSWLHREKSSQKKHEEKIKKEITEIYESSRRIYGSPKITRILRSRGHRIAERTVGKYMHEMGIKACYREKWTKTTVTADFTARLKNILKRDFNPDRPDAAWCTDITYIWTFRDGFVYLTSVMDLYSRKIVAWELTRDLKAESILKVIEKAQSRRNVRRPLIIHSDRGIQYTSEEYQEITEKMERSYSMKGTPWDNACIESFHALIKREWLSRYKIWSYEQAYRLIFEYIDTFYNTVRIHSHCGYLSPNEYEKQYYNNKMQQLSDSL